MSGLAKVDARIQKNVGTMRKSNAKDFCENAQVSTSISYASSIAYHVPLLRLKRCPAVCNTILFRIPLVQGQLEAFFTDINTCD